MFFFEATSGMKVFVEQEFIYKVHLGGAKFWGDFMVFLSAVVHLQISLLCSKGCKLWLMAFSYVLMPMHFWSCVWTRVLSSFVRMVFCDEFSVYVELFQSTKGEMITALQQRIYGMLLGVGGFSQFGSPNQVKNNNNIFWRNVVVMW